MHKNNFKDVINSLWVRYIAKQSFNITYYVKVYQWSFSIFLYYFYEIITFDAFVCRCVYATYLHTVFCSLIIKYRKCYMI